MYFFLRTSFFDGCALATYTRFSFLCPFIRHSLRLPWLIFRTRIGHLRLFTVAIFDNFTISPLLFDLFSNSFWFCIFIPFITTSFRYDHSNSTLFSLSFFLTILIRYFWLLCFRFQVFCGYHLLFWDIHILEIATSVLNRSFVSLYTLSFIWRLFLFHFSYSGFGDSNLSFFNFLHTHFFEVLKTPGEIWFKLISFLSNVVHNLPFHLRAFHSQSLTWRRLVIEFSKPSRFVGKLFEKYFFFFNFSDIFLLEAFFLVLIGHQLTHSFFFTRAILLFVCSSFCVTLHFLFQGRAGRSK